MTGAPTKVIGTKQEHAYVERSAVRLMLQNDDNEIAIIWVEKGQYFKLPGGGVEGDEDHVLAAEREAIEETGCTVQVDKECIAVCEEWRNDLHQLSYCYSARLLHDTGKVQLTEDELAEGLKHQWCNASEAMQKLRDASPTSELGRYIQARDIFFVEQCIDTK